METTEKWTAAELRKFDELTEAASQPGFDFKRNRPLARIALRAFVEKHGEAKCKAMMTHLRERDRRDNISDWQLEAR
jgi:Fe-S cluster assembly iron-binding protein IscA